MSPIALYPLDDLLNEFTDRLLSPFELGALGVVGFFAQRLVGKQHMTVRLIDDLDLDRQLQPPPRRQRLVWIGAEADGYVGIVRLNDPVNERIGSVLRRVANAKPALQFLAHLVVELFRNIRRRRLIIEGRDRHRVDMRRQTASREAVNAACRGKENERTSDQTAKSTHQTDLPRRFW